MTDKKISELNAMTASEIANDDEIVISDTSATHTKKSAISELSTFFGINPEGQRDTVGAMFTAGSHSGVTVTYDDPNDKIDIVLNGNVTDAELGHLNGVTSDIQTQLNNKAGLASPAFTGNPTATTQTADNNSTRIATTAYVQTELTNYASDSATFTNKGGAISQWTNDSGYTTASSTNTFTNKSGNISQWTNDSNYLTPSSTNTLTNKSIDGAGNTITNVPYTAISNIVDTDITSVSASDNELASSKAIKAYVDSQISGIDTLAEAGDSNISSPSAGQILVHDGTDSFDNQTSTVTLSGAVTGTANMDSSGDFAITTTIPTNTITINGQSVALGGSATIPSVLQSGGTFTGELHLNDDVLLSFGGASGSGDFSISHDSSSNKTIFAEGGTSDLEIRASDFVVKNGANNKTMINAEDGGSVELYEDNTKVFETSATGVDITGNIVVSGTVDGVDIGALNTAVGNLATVATTGLYSDLSGSPTLATVATSGAYSDLSGTPTIPTAIGGANGVDFNDDVKARFGTGNDFEIYHDSSNDITFLNETGSGNLHIRGGSIIFKSQTDNDDYIKCIEDGEVSLYHNNAKKLDTTATGIDVNGTVTATAFSGSLSGNISQFTNNSGYLTQVTSGGATTISAGNGIGLNTGNGTITMSGSFSGNFSATGNITAFSSDERLKNFQGKIENALDKVDKLSGYYYEWNDIAKGIDAEAFKDGVEVGVNAQEVEEVMPEVVTQAPIVDIHNLDTDYKTVYYDKLVPLLIESVKELKNRNERLELIVNRLITEVEEK